MRLLLIIISLLTFSSAYNQQRYPDSSCLKVIEEIKRDWRLDSIGVSGFRLNNYEKFLNCKLGYLYPDYLLNSIGRPNEVWRTENETSYIFYYSTKPLLSGLTRFSYIRFKVTSPGNYVVEVEKGEIER